MARKKAQAFRTITEVSDWLDTPSHVLRFWESKFSQIKPVKRAGGRRYYRPEDLKLIGGIKVLLHDQGTSIAAVKDMIKTEGEDHVETFSPDPVFPEKGRRKTRKAKEDNAASDTLVMDQPIETAPTEAEPVAETKPAEIEPVAEPQQTEPEQVEEPKPEPLVLEPAKPAGGPMVLETLAKTATPLALSTVFKAQKEEARESTARDDITAATIPNPTAPSKDSNLAFNTLKSREALAENDILDIEDLYFQLQRIRNRMKRRLDAL